MSELAQLTTALKLSVKARGLTYADLAAGLGLSEASVKRLFSDQSFTLVRVEQILGILGMSFLDLARLAANAGEAQLSTFTLEQEELLAADPKLFSYFYLLLGGAAPAEIVGRYDVAEAEGRRFLARLEAVGLVARHPGERVRLLTGKQVHWLANGPLRRTYASRMMSEFLSSPFTGDGEVIDFAPGRLGAASRRVLVRKIERLVRDFMATSEASQDLPSEEAPPVALLVALRPWTFSVIDELRRRKRR